MTLREYRKGTAQWTIHVDGAFAIENWRTPTKTASRDAAIALAEKKISAKEKAGYTLRLIELKPAEHPNPEPKFPKSAPSRPAFAKRPGFPKPATAHGAVDCAIAMRKFRKSSESSWEYFLRTYGSITWILDAAVDTGLSMFYCGNVTGGGWSCLEIAENIYDIDALIEATHNTSLEVLEVFHGGWHHDQSFAFDTRTRGRTGDAAIIPFGENIAELPAAPRANTVKPFGDWLLARVMAQTKIAEKNIRELG